MKRDILIGVDGGTGSLRAGFFDVHGNALSFASTPYPTKHEKPGWAEQSPADWWSAMRQSIRNGMKKAGVGADRILGLCAATTSCSVVLCNRDGTPLRDCLIWMDVRAAEESEEIEQKTGEKLSAEWMPAKLLWLKRHEPQNYNNAEVFCEYQDLLTYWLTGKWSININTSCNWCYDARKGGFAKDFYEKIGLSEAVLKFPADNIYSVGEKIGTLTPEAAEYLGLDECTIVANGGIDSSIGVLGMGVTAPGQIALMTGSSNLAMALTEKPILNDATVNLGPDMLIKGYYTAYRGQISSGSILNWFKDEFCKDLENPYETLGGEAKELPVGSEGLLVLDYWQGNKHPYLDAAVRGMFYGLSLNHTRAHMFRAIMEGVAFGTENLFKQFRENGYNVKQINICGGTTNSDLFLQIHADVSNVAVNVPKERQGVSLGAAISAAVACGIYIDLPQAVSEMVAFERVISPDSARHEAYAKIFAQYAKIYPLFKDWMHETAAAFPK